MKVLLLLAKGFETMEASVFIDIMGWARNDYHHDIEVATCGFQKTVVSAFGIPVTVDVLLNDICALREGKRVLRKRYDYPNHRRAPQMEEYLEPHDVIILEGIHAFYDERLRKLMDLKLYVRVDPDICLLRRIQRDINERGRDIDNISMQYTTTVKPMFDQYIRSYEQHADVIVARGGKNAKINEILASYINNDLHMFSGNAEGGTHA